MFFCLCKNYVHADAQCGDISIGVRDACANWQCWRRQFSTTFYKKQYLSNGQASCREISHKHCK